MSETGKILVVQTAFIGDVVLTTPLLDGLHSSFKEYEIDVVVIPAAAELLMNHPAVHEVIVYDKRGKDRGLSGIAAMRRRIKEGRYDLAVIPHRSLRSGLICSFAGIPRRIAFSTSSASFLMTDVVEYDTRKHEVDRNLSLLAPLSIQVSTRVLPSLYPSTLDSEIVTKLLSTHSADAKRKMIALSPGSVWATKRWLEERFADLAKELLKQEFSIALVGGPSDVELGDRIESLVSSTNLVNAINKLTLLQSAELIRRSKVLVSNDSAPLHIGVAMRTAVVAIFGATVPAFGFAPLGEHNQIVQTDGLECRPCTIHGGHRCPINTFDCMKRIQVDDVLRKIQRIISTVG